jgi:hypothetical protein
MQLAAIEISFLAGIRHEELLELNPSPGVDESGSKCVAEPVIDNTPTRRW